MKDNTDKSKLIDCPSNIKYLLYGTVTKHKDKIKYYLICELIINLSIMIFIVMLSIIIFILY